MERSPLRIRKEFTGAFSEIFYGDDFSTLRQKGAHVQRPLWASTSTKDPAYRDVLYVEELIGPDTVNTLPLATLNAFRDHGRVRGDTVQENLPDAEDQLRRLIEAGNRLWMRLPRNFRAMG